MTKCYTVRTHITNDGPRSENGVKGSTLNLCRQCRSFSAPHSACWSHCLHWRLPSAVKTWQTYNLHLTASSSVTGRVIVQTEKLVLGHGRDYVTPWYHLLVVMLWMTSRSDAGRRRMLNADWSPPPTPLQGTSFAPFQQHQQLWRHAVL